MEIPLTELHIGDKAVITRITGKGDVMRRIIDMGLIKGTKMRLVRVAPIGGPLCVCVRGMQITLRQSEAAFIYVTTKQTCDCEKEHPSCSDRKP